MTDRSVVGWVTVAECETNPMASDTEDEKVIRQIENRALASEKVKSLTNLPLAFPVRNHHASSFGSNRR